MPDRAGQGWARPGLAAQERSGHGREVSGTAGQRRKGTGGVMKGRLVPDRVGKTWHGQQNWTGAGRTV